MACVAQLNSKLKIKITILSHSIYWHPKECIWANCVNFAAAAAVGASATQRLQCLQGQWPLDWRATAALAAAARVEKSGSARVLECSSARTLERSSARALERSSGVLTGNKIETAISVRLWVHWRCRSFSSNEYVNITHFLA